MADDKIKVNRAPVLTLWAAVVAEQAGYDRQEALTLGRAVAGLNAQSKGKSLGIFEGDDEPAQGKPQKGRDEARPRGAETVAVLGRPVPIVYDEKGIRALQGDNPMNPASVERYLKTKFGDRLADVRAAMEELASSFGRDELEAKAYALYEAFRPEIPAGKKGWGAAGELNLEQIRSLGKEK